MPRRYATLNVRKDKVKRLGIVLDKFPSAGPHCNITGMKNKYWGKDALCIKVGVYVYHVDKETYETLGGAV